MLNRFKKITLLLGDLVCLHLALVLTLVIRYRQTLWLDNWTSHWPIFWLVFIIWLLILYINDLYNLNLRPVSRKFFRSTGQAALISSVLSIFYFYINASTSITPKTNLVLFSVIFLILFLVWRSLYQMAIHSWLKKETLAIIGSNQLAEKLIAEIKDNPGSGYQAALILKDHSELATFPEQIKIQNIHTIVVCDDFGRGEKISAVLFACLAYNVNFFNYPNFYELLTGKIPVEAIGPDWFIENIKEGEKNYFNFTKQLMDFSAALIILAVSLIFWPLIALFIKLTSPGPVFFYQKRLGKQEKIFKLIKFRTMRTVNNDLTPTIENDGRITGFGSFLRTTRLDEIPQVLNILKGEMSFIGPRPERPEIAQELEKQIPFYKTRLLIKPGLTGWDQVSGKYHSPSLTDSLEKLQYDLFYLKRRSIYLDLSIILKTLATIVSRSGR